MNVAKKIILALWLALLWVGHVNAAVVDVSGNHTWKSFNVRYDSMERTRSGYDGYEKSYWVYDEVQMRNAADRETADGGDRSRFADFTKFLAAEESAGVAGEVAQTGGRAPNFIVSEGGTAFPCHKW